MNRNEFLKLNREIKKELKQLDDNALTEVLNNVGIVTPLHTKLRFFLNEAKNFPDQLLLDDPFWGAKIQTSGKQLAIQYHGNAGFSLVFVPSYKRWF